MCEERMEPETGEKPEQKPYKPGAGMKFCGVLLAVCFVTAGLFFLLAWVSYQVRFSTEVIRMGITGLYIVPCLIGGRIIRRMGFTPAMVWGAGLGVAFYAVLLVISWLEAGMQLETVITMELILCVASGLLGTLSRKKQVGNAEGKK